MIGKEVTQSRPISLSETLEILEERKKAGELGYEQQIAYDHAKKFTVLSVEKANKLSEELEELGISKKTSTKISEILPVTEVQLRNVLLIEKNPIEDEVVKKAFEAVGKYRGK
ncbi:MAG: DNA-directed RNA polymerase subunit F [Candidatus Micrarchaeota archaeon]|nr:DNA-directed RNA polymerase subunit F [Candidatus Micrarchaeota archaeon]MDE1847498.1 DNA-directed RNA polymerase subunit F [Candidatus Micrarchaeota archaeon]MDE1863866.1 DNA-directed RNA polymerase subunit F [Candidatus Micrarchaeota archaeon]